MYSHGRSSSFMLFKGPFPVNRAHVAAKAIYCFINLVLQNIMVVAEQNVFAWYFNPIQLLHAIVWLHQSHSLFVIINKLHSPGIERLISVEIKRRIAEHTMVSFAKQ